MSLRREDDMKCLIYKPLWGHEGSLDEAIRQAVEAGFDGIEGPVPAETPRPCGQERPAASSREEARPIAARAGASSSGSIAGGAPSQPGGARARSSAARRSERRGPRRRAFARLTTPR